MASLIGVPELSLCRVHDCHEPVPVALHLVLDQQLQVDGLLVGHLEGAGEREGRSRSTVVILQQGEQVGDLPDNDAECPGDKRGNLDTFINCR